MIVLVTQRATRKSTASNFIGLYIFKIFITLYKYKFVL